MLKIYFREVRILLLSNITMYNPDQTFSNLCIKFYVGTRHAETEADMEAAVASILVEKMKQKAPQKQTFHVVHLEEKQLEEVASGHFEEPTVEHTSIVDYQTEPDPLLHIVEHTDQLEPGMVVESMEIPSTNVYIYDNPFYLNRLMKDNTCGRRARHDAPYTHRLGLCFLPLEMFFCVPKLCVISLKVA